MRATEDASSARACLTRVTSSPMAETLCRAGAIGKRSPQKIDAGRLVPMARATAESPVVAPHGGPIVAGSWRAGKCVSSLLRKKTRYTWTKMQPLCRGVGHSAHRKRVGTMVLVGRALRAEQCAECMASRARVAKTGTKGRRLRFIQRAVKGLSEAVTITCLVMS